MLAESSNISIQSTLSTLDSNLSPLFNKFFITKKWDFYQMIAQLHQHKTEHHFQITCIILVVSVGREGERYHGMFFSSSLLRLPASTAKEGHCINGWKNNSQFIAINKN